MRWRDNAVYLHSDRGNQRQPGGLVATKQGITTPFKVHSDSAPTIYITSNPARDAAVTRTFERATGKLTAVNPITGNTDTQPEITTTWLGMVAPGIDQAGVDSTTWSDHADIRPTMLVLLGLKDDYAHEGRALVETFDGWAVPASAKKNGSFVPLAQALKQIDAPVGPLALASLQASTVGLESNDAGDAAYTSVENQLISLTTQRDAVAAQILALLEAAEFEGTRISQQQAKQLIQQAQALLATANSL